MRLLLDTHVYLWWLRDDRKLSARARKSIADADEIFVSSVSIWEASIKSALGKLHVDVDALVTGIAISGFQELSMTAKHAARITTLPRIHRDPFDRMLIAQALCEPLRLLTIDARLREYTDLVEVI